MRCAAMLMLSLPSVHVTFVFVDYMRRFILEE